MSQTPHPHDPFAAESGASAQEPLPEQPEARPASEHLDIDAQDPYAPAPQDPAVQGGAASDPVQHPHDPYAASADGLQADAAPQGAPAGGSVPPQDQYASPAEHASVPPHQPAPHPAAQAGPVPGGTMQFDQPPAHLKGVFDGPLPGLPTTDSDAKLWAMFAQLSAIVGYVIGAGFLGWLGPLIIFLVYKDRNRYVRYNAAESLNAAIATLIAEIVLGIVFGIITIITLGFGSVLFALIGVPALVHIIFAIIGAVKANQGEWWNYPINIRLVK